MTNTKVQRKDVISQKEFDGMLAKADALKYVKEYYRERDKAVICTFKAFGKRRGEIAWLEVSDLQIVGDNLSVTFTLEKKRKKLLMAIRSEKQIPLSDPLTEPILEYWNWIKRNHPECKYLFPTTFYSGLTGAMTFKKDQHLSGRQILRIVKKLNDKAWPHLFRETAGAEVVRADRSIMAAFKVMLRLDLEDEATALRYVRRYAVDVIDRGVSDEQKDEIRKILAEAALTEKQRAVLLNVLSRI